MTKPDQSLFACPLPNMRKRSRLSERDCLKAVGTFFRKVERLKESSESFDNIGNPLQQGYISVRFLVKGGFGVADDLFEAMRVLSGYKLPRKDVHATTTEAKP